MKGRTRFLALAVFFVAGPYLSEGTASSIMIDGGLSEPKSAEETVAPHSLVAIGAETPVLQDGDGDGVPDELDKCPNTHWGAVNELGCPTDSDGDGVADELDNCHGTSLGVKVGPYGCPEEKSYQLIVEFLPGEVEILPKYHEELKRAAEFISDMPAGVFRIEGHTDSVGTVDANRRISSLRAESVRKYLLKQFDISSNRVEVKAYGESRPVADNGTQEGRQQNRRVVIVYHPGE